MRSSINTSLLVIIPILITLGGCADTAETNEQRERREAAVARHDSSRIAAQILETQTPHSANLEVYAEPSSAALALSGRAPNPGDHLYVVENRDGWVRFRTVLYDTASGGWAEAKSLVGIHSYLTGKADRAREEADARRPEELRNTIRVRSVRVSRPNSVGGVDVNVHWTNKSSKTIKYVSFDVVPYNAVGDVVACEIRRHAEAGVKETGPFRPGQGNRPNESWQNVWYNPTIRRAELTGIRIIYMDSSNETITGADLKYVM
jgi:hypothetical protein